MLGVPVEVTRAALSTETMNDARKDLIVMILHEKVRQALTAGHPAHLVTLNEDGSPQISLVFVVLDGDEIVCGHLSLHKKLKNMQREVVLQKLAKEHNGQGFPVLVGLRPPLQTSGR